MGPHVRPGRAQARGRRAGGLPGPRHARALAQVLATLIENSLKHGAGTTTIRARPSGTSGAVALEVGDEGEESRTR
ncbi:hypothetical protein NKG05_20705 [Oerskovia sp. M15]